MGGPGMGMPSMGGPGGRGMAQPPMGGPGGPGMRMAPPDGPGMRGPGRRRGPGMRGPARQAGPGMRGNIRRGLNNAGRPGMNRPAGRAEMDGPPRGPEQGTPIFRAYRYGPDYPGLKGRDLTPGDPIDM